MTGTIIQSIRRMHYHVNTDQTAYKNTVDTINDLVSAGLLPFSWLEALLSFRFGSNRTQKHRRRDDDMANV